VPTHRLEISGLTHRYLSTPVLRDVDVAVGAGAFVCVLGPSGSGKTTLLRAIAGMVNPTAGRILIAGDVVFDASTGVSVPPERRRLGMVFQDYALWPHLSALENVAFPLRVARDPHPKRQAGELLERVGLTGLERHRPAELSGGQQQRVALARALAARPSVLLLDEPLSALDAPVRAELRALLKRLAGDMHFTALHVTHDPIEAFELATHVVVMADGRIAHQGTAEQVYSEPETLTVARLGGAVSVLPVVCRGVDTGRAAVDLEGRRIVARAHRDVQAGPARLLLRMHSVTVCPGASADALQGTVVQTRFQGAHYLLDVRLAGENVGVATPTPYAVNATIHLHVDPDAAWVVPAAGTAPASALLATGRSS